MTVCISRHKWCIESISSGFLQEFSSNNYTDYTSDQPYLVYATDYSVMLYKVVLTFSLWNPDVFIQMKAVEKHFHVLLLASC